MSGSDDGTSSERRSTCLLAHHVDVGGGAPASVGALREIYDELLTA